MSLSIRSSSLFLHQIKAFFMERFGLISFFIITLFILGGAAIFYLDGWLTVNSAPPAMEVKLPLNEALWRVTLLEIHQRQITGETPQGVRDIFRSSAL